MHTYSAGAGVECNPKLDSLTRKRLAPFSLLSNPQAEQNQTHSAESGISIRLKEHPQSCGGHPAKENPC